MVYRYVEKVLYLGFEIILLGLNCIILPVFHAVLILHYILYLRFSEIAVL